MMQDLIKRRGQSYSDISDAGSMSVNPLPVSVQDKVTKVTGAMPDAEDEVLVGVGFGPNFYRQITDGRGAPENFSYPHRKGTLGEMPSTGMLHHMPPKF